MSAVKRDSAVLGHRRCCKHATRSGRHVSKGKINVQARHCDDKGEQQCEGASVRVSNVRQSVSATTKPKTVTRITIARSATAYSDAA